MGSGREEEAFTWYADGNGVTVKDNSGGSFRLAYNNGEIEAYVNGGTMTAYLKKSQASNDELGDTNFDGVVDGRDATIVLTEYAKSSVNGGSPFASSQRTAAAADIDGNGVIDGRDATAILTYYAFLSVDGNPEIDIKTWYDSNNR